MHTRDEFFEKAFNKAFGRMEDYHFVGFNKAMGCHIYGKDHYKAEMKRRGLVPFEEAERLAQEHDYKHEKPKEIELSEKASSIIRSLKLTADKDGNIKLGGRAIEALMAMGAISNVSYSDSLNTKAGGMY